MTLSEEQAQYEAWSRKQDPVIHLLWIHIAMATRRPSTETSLCLLCFAGIF